ncbi:MAG: sigma-54 dependent transcriptional regulator [Pseudomonadota bacterium]|nr:sigma-54 dependent transcriptional regulator [Pseudomonadota bacterium]
MSDSLLLIEDEPLLRAELAEHFRDQHWEVLAARSLADARRLLLEQGHEPLVVVADMNLPDGNALDLLEALRRRRQPGEWIFLTGFGGVPESVRALKLGAFDFLEKPCEPERLDMVVAGAARSARAQRRLTEQAATQTRRYAPESFIGRSPAAARVRQLLGKLTQVPFSALVISGETGTGKGLAAKILHHAGLRCEGPLVEINCAALPRELLESELFGFEAGAFTGARGRRRGLLEQAHGGTLFLDEIGELDLDLQTKVLKAIEEKTVRRLGGERELRVDVQIVAATNRDLASLVAEQRFRSDLYHRLNVFRLELPPLRARKEDLEDLVPLFVAEYNAKAGRAVRTVPDEVWARLRRHDWPGNIRELRNVVERCVLFADSGTFPAEWLQLDGPAPPVPVQSAADQLVLPMDGSMALEDMDRYIIQTALERHGRNVSATARALGTTRETLRYRIAKYGLGAD